MSSLNVFLGNVSMWLFLPKYISKTSVCLDDIVTHFKETLVYFAPAVATTIYTVLDKTLIGVITLDDNQNGYYEQATKIISVCKSLCFAGINGVMTSRMSYYYSKKMHSEISSGILATMNLTMFLSIGACFGLIGVSSDFVPFFFGNGYDETIYILNILASIIPIICVSNVLGSVIYAPSGRIKKATSFMVIGSFINLLLNIPLIIWLKAYGAAIASICAEAVISILFFVYVREFITFHSFLQIVWKKILSAFIMLLLIKVIRFFLLQRIDVFPLLIVEVLLGGAVYALILFLLKDNSFSIAMSSIFKRNRKASEEDVINNTLNNINTENE